MAGGAAIQAWWQNTAQGTGEPAVIPNCHFLTQKDESEQVDNLIFIGNFYIIWSLTTIYLLKTNILFYTQFLALSYEADLNKNCEHHQWLTQALCFFLGLFGKHFPNIIATFSFCILMCSMVIFVTVTGMQFMF